MPKTLGYLVMLAYFLAVIIAVVSLNLYLTAFIRPNIHRQDDFLWSGLGLFYALTLWICAGRFTGAVLLSQMAITTVTVAFIWENTQLRKAWRQNETNSLEGFSVLSFILSVLAKLPNLIQKKNKSSAPHPASKTPQSVTKSSLSVTKEDNNVTTIPDITPEIQEALENVDELETLPNNNIVSTLVENTTTDVESPEVNLSDQIEMTDTDSEVENIKIEDKITASDLKEENQNTTSVTEKDDYKEEEIDIENNQNELVKVKNKTPEVQTNRNEKKGFFSKLINILNRPKKDNTELKNVTDNNMSLEDTKDDDDWLNDDDSSSEDIDTLIPENNQDQDSAPQPSLEMEENIEVSQENETDSEVEGAVEEIIETEETQKESELIEEKLPELEVEAITENADNLLTELKENIEEVNETMESTTENQEIPAEDTINNLLELTDQTNLDNPPH
ncbi:MAG: hypothetical protein IGQ45_13615 [Cyanobacterium sp. T60_A2020_053]|nr:hypothetical protein [Cyanobacterium sp. T60_A2020_053]